MAENIDLKDLEKRTFKSTMQDGFFDIYFGILILGNGFASIFDAEQNTGVYFMVLIAIIGVGLAVFIAGKKLVTEPRMGKVKFGKARKVRKAKTSIILSINALVLLIIFLITANTGGSAIIMDPLVQLLLMGIFLMALPLCLVGYFLQFPRLYLYGVLFGTLFFFVEILRLFVASPFNVLIAFGTVGGVITITGIVVLIQFLKKYPKPPQEVTE